MALRYESEFLKDESSVKRTAKFLYTKAKISRAQYYRSMNELENNGLVLRDRNNAVGDKCVFHVAKDLGYFLKQQNTDYMPVSLPDRGVSEREGGISNRDTDHYSFSLSSINTTNSESSIPPAAATGEKVRSKPVTRMTTEQKNKLMWEMIGVYREIFPDNPQPHKRVIAKKLQKTLLELISIWPRIDPKEREFTIEAFRKYLLSITKIAPQFAFTGWTRSSGKERPNDMITFCKQDNVIGFLEGKYK